MDDSIWRDFYGMADQAKVSWAQLRPILTSDQAVHIYVILASSIAVSLSLIIAYRAKRNLKELRLEAFQIRFRGQPPKRDKAIQKRLADIQARTKQAWIGFAKDFFLLFMFGLLVPSIALLLLCLHYTWFDGSGIAFIDLHENKPIANSEIFALTGFVINQISHGALLDFPEVFNIDFGRLTNNPSNMWFSGLVFLFRTLISGFSLALIIAIRDTAFVLWKLRSKAKIPVAIHQENGVASHP